MADIDKLMTCPEVARFLRTGKDQVYKMVKSGILKYVVINNSIKIRKEWVLEMLEKYVQCDLTDPESVTYRGE